MSHKRIKPLIVIVQRIVPHYRLSFFNLLSLSNPDLDIRVYHGNQIDQTRVQVGFVEKEFKTHTLHLFGYLLVFQPGLAWNILLERPDLVILEGTFGMITNFTLLLVRKLLGVPSLFWTAGWNNPNIKGFRSSVKSYFIRLCLFLADGAIVYGSSASNYVEAHGFPKNKIVIAQNTIDVESILNSHDERSARGLAIRERLLWQNKIIILYVGQISPIKRVDILLEAYSRLREEFTNTALLIIGEGKQHSKLEQFVNLKNIPDVYFAGEVVENVGDYFAAADLFVLPGTGGLALNEAMASSLPVIATIADGTQDDLIMPGENGYIVPVDDPKLLESAISKIISSPGLAKTMGKNSLRIIQEKATLHNMVGQYSMGIRQFLPRR